LIPLSVDDFMRFIICLFLESLNLGTSARRETCRWRYAAFNRDVMCCIICQKCGWMRGASFQ
jgi:hypothetical protein